MTEAVSEKTDLPRETLQAFGGDELRARVFYEKYALRDPSGKQIEKTPDDLWRRVATELASPEKDAEKRKEWGTKFYWLLQDYRFVPGGRILFGAGQSRKSTLLNCLDGDTEVLVKEAMESKRQVLGYNNKLVTETKYLSESVMKVKIREILGREVLVLTQQGWKPVTFRPYGRQEVFRVLLRNGDEFIATGNHEWPIFYHTKQRPSKTTTINLKGKKLFISLPARPERDQDFKDGVVHGIIYGDGQKNSAATTYGVYLFGAQMGLVPYLKDYGTVTEYAGDNPAWKGAVFVGGIRSRYDLKAIPPTDLSASYWYGFILGLIATDGHCSSNGQAGIDQADFDDLKAIREQVVRVGMYPNKIFRSREKNPYTGEYAPLYRFNISKFSLQEADLLRGDHRRKFAGRRITQKVGNHTEVKDVIPLHETREVYCCTEPATHTFTIGNGILTGNCYFFKIREDSIEAIFDWCKEAARTYSFGGGVGTDISVLRPKGAPVNNAAIFSSGSVSFMELLSTTTGTIGQAGRRGALMITIRVDHPDITDFINVKRDLKKVNYANISVKITDDFMRAVETDGDFLLRFKNEKVEMTKTVRARDVWKSLVRGAWESAEPGVIFWDTIKRESTTEYNGMEVEGVNPCVTGNTLVLTPSGWIRADSLKEGDKIVTAYGSVKPITKIEKTEDTDVYRVEFTDGGYVDVSPGHIFHTRAGQKRGAGRFDKFWDRERRLHWLRPGDLVRLGKVYSPPENEVSTMGIPDGDFGFINGVLLGDGAISEAVMANGQAKIASDKRETEWNSILLEKFSVIAPNIAVSANSRSNSCYVYLYKDGTEFILRHTLLRPSKSGMKEIPVEYINSNREFHAGLLDGLFSTDGDVDLNPSNPTLRLASTSRRMLEQVRLILQFYGINAKIYRTAPAGKETEIGGRKVVLGNDAWQLCVFGGDLKTFSKLFSLTHPAKRKKLESIRDMVGGSVSDSTRIKGIAYLGKETVYDIYEEETDTWITNGYVSRGCSEQTLESYGCCCLGSVNLSAFVKEPFTERASIDWDSLTRASQFAVRFLDNVLDYNAERHPLPQQKKASLWSRRIGVGVTGLGDMLIKLGLKYDEDSTIGFVDHLFERIKNVIYDYSTELAKEKGSFPAFDAEKHLAQPFVQRLDEKVKEKIRTQGIRNAAITTIPPVGSGSILAGCSSGVEPVFALSYTRRSKSLSEGEFKVFHPLVKEYMHQTGSADEGQLPNYFVTAHQIRPEMRVKMQATIQKHIDTAISSCLTEDSMILTSEGPRILEDLVSKNTSIGFHGHDLAVVNEDGETRESDSYFVNGTQPVKRAKLFGNRTIEGTPNHRVRVLDLNYNIVWKRLDELTTNDWVVGRVGLDVWGSNENSIASIIGERFAYERRTNSKEIVLPVRPTRDLGRLLGYIVADGGINLNGVSISMRDDDSCFNDCVELPKRVFGLEPQVRPDSRSPHLQEIRINSRELVAWLGYAGLKGDCYTKQVPKVILGAGRETVKEFIRGVTHDGNVSNSSINVVGVTNRRLATQIMYLLENFGVVSTLQVEEREGQYMIRDGQATSYALQDVYCVTICGHEAVKYVDMIGFAQEEKWKKAETIFGHRDDRIVPYGTIPDYGLRKEFRRQALPRIRNVGLYRHFHSLSSTREGRPTIDRDTVLAMMDVGFQVPEYLVDPTYVFQKVEEISDGGTAPTFDLSVPEGNNYIANGIICHNTVNLPQEITPEEVEKIYLLAWSMGCFTKGNDIYTKDGLKDISDIKSGDYVLSHDGGYHRVTEVYHLPSELRRFVRLDIQGMEDLVATAEHPVLVLRPTAKHWQKRSWEEQEPRLMWVKIADVREGDHVVLPRFRFDNGRIEEIKVSDFVDCVVRDGKAYPCRTLPWKKDRVVTAANSNGINNVIRLDNDFVWFLGWFVAEGHFDGNSYVRMTLSPEEADIADKLERIVYEKFGLRARRETIRSGGVSLRLQWGSAVLNQLLSRLVGRGALNKHLPPWFTGISPELLETMVSAWSSGDSDGTAKGGVTMSKRLWREVFMAQSQLNHLTMRVSRKASGLYAITQGDSNYVGKHWNNYLCYRVKGRSEFLSSEPVYNFAVEGTDSYVVNGVTVHNCKGITVYREGSREGILETEKVVKRAETPKVDFERPRLMEGKTLKLKLPQGGLYLTANLVGGELKEVFVTLGKSGGDEKADAEALGRLISLYLQHGGDIKSVISTLKGIKGKYVSWDEGTQLLSIPDAIAKALELLTLNHVVKESDIPTQSLGARVVVQGGTCPDCHESTLVFENGCYHCGSCGYSKCE